MTGPSSLKLRIAGHGEGRPVSGLCDVDGMEIHYSDFVAAMLQTRVRLHESLVREAFRRFDVEGSGYVSLRNIRQVMGNEFEGAEAEEILREVNHAADGKISYEAFLRAVMQDDTCACGQDAVAQACAVRGDDSSNMCSLCHSNEPSGASADTAESGKHSAEGAAEENKIYCSHTGTQECWKCGCDKNFTSSKQVGRRRHVCHNSK